MFNAIYAGATPYYAQHIGDIISRVLKGEHLEQPEKCSPELYDIMKNCWKPEPSDRPTFAALVGMLEKLLLTNLDYLVLDENELPTDYYNVAPENEKL